MNPDTNNMTMSQLNELDELPIDRFYEWKDHQPDSPTPSGLRLAVRGAYQLQEMRISLGNQCFSQFRHKLGIAPQDSEDSDKEAKEALDTLRAHFEKVTHGVPGMLGIRQFKVDGVFSDFAEFQLCNMFVNSLRDEEQSFANLKHSLKSVPVYNTFLLGVAGCGTALSGFLLSELNPYRARHASSFWRYLGLDVARDGTGRSNKRVHMEPTWSRKSDGNGGYRMVKEPRMTYNPTSKAKVAGVLADSLVRAGLRWSDASDEEWDNTPDAFRRIKEVNKSTSIKQVASLANRYIEYYLDYKHRKANSIAPAKVWRKVGNETQLVEIPWCETLPTHRDRAAKRAMVKQFLADFWAAWREAEGLPVSKPYAEEFLGRRPHGDRNDSAA